MSELLEVLKIVGIWIVSILTVTITIFYIYVKSAYSYFEKRGIPYAKPTFPFGSFGSLILLRKSFNSTLAEIYENYPGHKLVGYFLLWQKQILVRDLQIIKRVLVKDFDFFIDRGLYFNKEKDPLSASLFAIEGYEWKTLRAKISPTFSSGKIKGMHPMIIDCANTMVDCITKCVSKKERLDYQELFSKYGLAIISTTAFGLDSECLTNDDSKFAEMGRKNIEATYERLLSFVIVMNNTQIAKIFKMLSLRVIPKPVEDYFLGLVKENVNYRKVNNVVRNDYMQLLIQLKETGTLDGEGTKVTLSLNELAAQAFVFILAGSETTSSAMGFCLYELSKHPEVQQKLHKELDSLTEISYDSINNCEYLDMVINESMRKHPPLGFLNRQCARDYLVPGTETVIEKGTQVMLSLEGLQNDPELFPNPEKFDPERFSKENKDNIEAMAYMPFGEGPRFCIGMRFGKIVVKTGLVTLLRRFEVCPPSTSTPPKIEPRTFNTLFRGGLWLTLKERATSGDD